MLQFQNAMYGTIVASLLYYRKFAQILTDVGFNINPYNPCVTNHMIDGQQMTICYHVDNCKLIHRKSKFNDRMIKWLRQEYESIFEDGLGNMMVIRGKVQNYLGMTLYYTVSGQAQITMINFLDIILIAFNKVETKGGGTKTSAAPENIFKVREDCEKLPQNKTVQFHNLVANTLYATKQSRPDTCTSVEFLTTIIRALKLDDWDNMVHIMRYIRGTRTLPLILSANGSVIFKWWVDASFAVHPNMQGHSCGGLSLGRRFPIVSSTKKISTPAAL